MERFVDLCQDLRGVALSEKGEIMTTLLSQQMMPKGLVSGEAIKHAGSGRAAERRSDSCRTERRNKTHVVA